MFNTLAVFVWVGGWLPAYRAARNNKHHIFSSVMNALVWPADVGWHLAHNHCQEDKG